MPETCLRRVLVFAVSFGPRLAFRAGRVSRIDLHDVSAEEGELVGQQQFEAESRRSEDGAVQACRSFFKESDATYAILLFGTGAARNLHLCDYLRHDSCELVKRPAATHVSVLELGGVP